MATIIEFGVNEVLPSGTHSNPFDNNFDTQEQAVDEGKAFLRENPEVDRVVIFQLTIRNNTIVGDTTLETITRKDLD